jgi:hypothetical protein
MNKLVLNLSQTLNNFDVLHILISFIRVGDIAIFEELGDYFENLQYRITNTGLCNS